MKLKVMFNKISPDILCTGYFKFEEIFSNLTQAYLEVPQRIISLDTFVKS
jgi:hypothetical protein